MALLAPLALFVQPSTPVLVIVTGAIAALLLGLVDDIRGPRPTLYALGLVAQSRAVLLIDGVFLALPVSGSRMFLVSLRHWFALRPHVGDRRVIIVGASESGEIALRLLLGAAQSHHPAGFLDDDPGKHRRRIGGVPVLGSVSELAEVARREKIDLVILAIDDDERREQVRQRFAHLDIEVREFPRAIR